MPFKTTQTTWCFTSGHFYRATLRQRGICCAVVRDNRCSIITAKHISSVTQTTSCDVVTMSDLNRSKSLLFYALGLPSYLWNGWSYCIQILYTEGNRDVGLPDFSSKYGRFLVIVEWRRVSAVDAKSYVHWLYYYTNVFCNCNWPIIYVHD